MGRKASSPVQKWNYVLASGVSILAFACARGVPQPDFVTPFDVVAPDSILDYLGDLKFDRRDGASHEQRLLVGCPDRCRLGPQVLVQPEKRSHNNSHDDLATGPGRIVARFINRDLKEGYSRLNLAPGDTVYWAVDKVRRVNDTLSLGRSLYISTKALRGGRDQRTKPWQLTIKEHRGQGKLSMSIAKWIFDTASSDTTGYEKREAPGGGLSEQQMIILSTAWGSCKKDACCK